MTKPDPGNESTTQLESSHSSLPQTESDIIAVEIRMNQMQNRIQLIEQYLDEMKNEMKALKKAISNSAMKTSTTHLTPPLLSNRISQDEDSALSTSPPIVSTPAMRNKSDVVDMPESKNARKESKKTTTDEPFTTEILLFSDEISLEDIPASSTFSTSASKDANNIEILDQMEKSQHKNTFSVETHDSAENSGKREHNIYNTGGLHMHAILKICCMEVGAMATWRAAIGSVIQTIIQLFMLNTIWVDTNAKIMMLQIEGSACRILHRHPITVWVFMSVLFSCIIYEDVKESVVEEDVLNHLLLRRKLKTSRLQATELVRFCLRVRRFVLPWLLVITAVSLMISEGSIGTNEIILNFLSIGFIADADNILGRFISTEKENETRDKIIADIQAYYDNDYYTDNIEVNESDAQHAIQLSSSSLFWSKMIALMPTMITTIVSIIIIQTKNCMDSLLTFNVSFGILLLPNAIFLTHCIKSSIRHRQRTLFQQYMNFVGEWSLNCLALIVFLIIMISTFNTGFSSTTTIMSYVALWLFFFICLGIRFYHFNYVSYNAEKTLPNQVFGLFSFVMILGYLAALISLAYFRMQFFFF